MSNKYITKIELVFAYIAFIFSVFMGNVFSIILALACIIVLKLLLREEDKYEKEKH